MKVKQRVYAKPPLRWALLISLMSCSGLSFSRINSNYGLFLLLEMPALAATQPNCKPIGRVNNIQGAATLKRNGESEVNITGGEVLCLQDQIIPAANGNITVFCEANNQEQKLPAGVKWRLNSICPIVLRCDKDEGACGRGETQTAQIISPRNTALLNNKPALRWLPISGASSYIVRLEELGEGEIWQLKTSQTEVIYRGTPVLKPGTSYRLIVETEIGEKSETTFNILPEKEAQEVRSFKQASTSAGQIPPLVILYVQNRLFAEAIEMLETAVKQGNESSFIYHQLGEIYSQIGVISEAEKAYKKAVERAVVEKNIKAEALALSQLGQLASLQSNQNQAISRLNEARVLYEKVGDVERVKEVNQLLENMR